MATVESTNPAAFEASQLLGNTRSERSLTTEQPANQPDLRANDTATTNSDVSSVDISQEARAAFAQDNADFQQALQDFRNQSAQQPAQLVANLFDDAAGSGNQSLTDALARLNSLAERLNDNRQAALSEPIERADAAEPEAPTAEATAAETVTTATQQETPAAEPEPEALDLSQRNPLDETGLSQG
ncbi:hypothetical protein QWY20_17325 [Alkalimonas sp. MEB108]|uniref:Uncharacterized protein n=1 Tax=Alkalimonas cellulosilytica TaxID=3058395 RepID=A0ABU7J9K6_9GAMM|nr:hypothetical protein [Alkalimonas sp. MEB108]MEE2003219.1 hypothetical protein [Alkalimonas sp. MEB108]